MKNLYLIGMMGCGKTTCGNLLSRRLERPFLDTDQTLEKETGKSVSQIFAEEGEGYFRDLETDLCRRLAKTRGRIVACGGGLPLREENRKLLRESGRVIFLRRDPGEIFDAVDMDGRPLGQGEKQAFLDRFAQRLPLYEAAAHIIIREFSTPEVTVEAIINALEKEEQP